MQGRTKLIGRGRILAVAMLLVSPKIWSQTDPSRHTYPQKKSARHGLAAFNGTYLGFIPSDESPIRTGEIEFKIECDHDRLIARIATGRRIETVERRCRDFIAMSADEVRTEFKPGSKVPARITGFRYKPGDWPGKLLFLRDPQWERREYGVIIRFETTDLLGPSQLFTPAQIRRGDYERFLATLERRVGKLNQYPRLKYGGLAKAMSDQIAEAIAAAQAGNCKRAFEIGKPLADRGVANVQDMIGSLYYLGCGVPQSYVQALAWYRKAAEQGETDALFNLGLMYSMGQGAAKNFTEAVKYYKRAADLGNTNAMVNLGTLYHDGRDVAQNPDEAMKWFRSAADAGAVVAFFNIGNMYYRGYGVRRNYAEAAQWFEKAASQGHAEAKGMLDFIREQGKAIP